MLVGIIPVSCISWTSRTSTSKISGWFGKSFTVSYVTIGTFAIVQNFDVGLWVERLLKLTPI